MENLIVNQPHSLASGKAATWTYRILTAFIVITMTIAGWMLLMRVGPNVEGVTHLGFPLYLCSILGVAKILAGVAIAQNRFPLIKEWAYAGYSFNLAGATASHVLAHDSVDKTITPAIILILLLSSYYLWKKQKQSINHEINKWNGTTN